MGNTLFLTKDMFSLNTEYIFTLLYCNINKDMLHLILPLQQTQAATRGATKYMVATHRHRCV